MTLILSFGNKDQVIQLSDRRLSNSSRVIEEESNKCGIMTCPNARLAFGYTGIARYYKFNTFDWLLQALHESAQPTFVAKDIIERLCENASKTFKQHPSLKIAPNPTKALSIMFSGYVYGSDYPQTAYAVASNYVNLETFHQHENVQEEFRVRFFSATDLVENPTMIQRIGNWQGITEKDIYELRQALMERKPRNALINIGVEFIRNLADKPASSKSIGKQITSICIPPDLQEAISTEYHSNCVKRETYMPAQVSLFPDRQLVISNISIRPVEDDTPPISVPKVSKNAPCPCGSKVRYKNCHGKRNSGKSQQITFEVTPDN